MSDERRVAPIPNQHEAGGTAPGLASAVAPSADRSPSVAPAADGATGRPRRDSSAGARKRNRMALRIPDDEVSRPHAASSDSVPVEVAPAISTPPPPSPSPFRVDDAAAIVQPTPIISINPEPTPAAAIQASAPANEARHAGPGATALDHESVEVRFDDDVPTPRATRTEPAPPPMSMPPPEPHRSPAPPTPPPAPSSAPPVTASPSSPAPAQARTRHSSAPRAEVRLAHALDGEISADDLVPVDATPAAPRVAALPSMRPRLPSHAPAPPPAAKKAAPSLAPRSARPPLVIVPPHMGTVGPQSREGSGLRRKGRFWWEDLFNDDYLRATERLTDDQLTREVNFIEESLGIERGGAVLDLACGTGRHAVELARRGYEVVGFDLSLAMLARASDEAQERSAKLNFVQGDMREMSFAEQFDGVFCWNTSFGFFEEEKNAHVVDRIHGALKAGGLLLLDVVNRDFIVRQSPSLAWFEGDGCVCMDEMSIDFITSRLRIKRTMMLDDGRSREIEYSLRIYSLHELGKMLHEHGFKVCEVSGRIATPGVFFGHDSPRTIVLAEKR